MHSESDFHHAARRRLKRLNEGNETDFDKFRYALTCPLNIFFEHSRNMFFGMGFRAFQKHVFRHGLHSLCLSDRGLQITAGSEIISDYLQHAETLMYMQSNGNSHNMRKVATCLLLIASKWWNSWCMYRLGKTSGATHEINRRPIGFRNLKRHFSRNFYVEKQITFHFFR